MKNNTTFQLEFAPLKKKKITAFFDDPQVSSDAGALYLREVDRRIGLIDRLITAMNDPRRQTHIHHQMCELWRQRVYQIACGYEDADDCDHLKGDPAFKIAAGRDPQDDPDLASQPTMSRLENTVTVRDLIRIGYALIDQFIDSYDSVPDAIVLDMDPTADTTYGHQQLRLFNAFEDEYCFMPFHVYEGQSGKLITTVLRAGKTPTAPEIISVLKRIVSRIRRAWPEVRIILRADGHHTKPKVMEWMEAHDIDYITGLSPNKRLNALFTLTIQDAERKYQQKGGRVRSYGSAYYAAGSWNDKERRVICRVVVSAKGTDTRYIVTSFTNAGAKYLYETVYCGRGAMELMIKDHKVGLQSDRTSCTRKEANQFRLFLHSSAYMLMYTLREQLLKGSELARAQFDTIRLRLLKLGARVEIRKTFIRFHLPSSYPLQSLLFRASEIFAAVPTSPS